MEFIKKVLNEETTVAEAQADIVKALEHYIYDCNRRDVLKGQIRAYTNGNDFNETKFKELLARFGFLETCVEAGFVSLQCGMTAYRDMLEHMRVQDLEKGSKQ